MEKLKLTKVQSDEVKALLEAKEAYEKAQEALDNAQEALDNAKKSTAKNKASLIGNAYIAFTEALEVKDNAFIAYNEALIKAKNNTVVFPNNDSKEVWREKGLEKEYNAISLWYKASDSILEAIQATKNVNIDKNDIINYLKGYTHQITNANDLVRLGYLDKNASILVENKSNFAFINKEARQCQEALEAKEKAITYFEDILNTVLDNFIE